MRDEVQGGRKKERRLEVQTGRLFGDSGWFLLFYRQFAESNEGSISYSLGTNVRQRLSGSSTC